MAYDKLVDSTQLDADLTAVANAIRAKSGGSGTLAFPSGFVSEIGNISGGGGEGGIALLASGTYTETGTPASLTIPVDYSGTPYMAVVTAAERAEGLSQCMCCVKCLTLPWISSLWTDERGFVWLCGYSSSDATSFGAPSLTNLNNYILSSTQIVFPRQDSTRVWRPVTYNWYILGEASE